MTTEKLHKILARCGVASRRKCENLIREGRVTVDGHVVRDVAVRFDPSVSRILVDGETIREPKKIHLLFYKPRGVVCTNYEGETKPRVIDFFRGYEERLYTVGRLDEDSEGLILVTNDGDFAEAVAHPRHGVAKMYEVLVAGNVRPDDVERIGRGVWIADGKTDVSSVRLVKRKPEATLLRVTLREGRNREVRRIFARLGYRVRRLRRVGIGSLGIGSLKPGRHRRLRADEIRELLGSTQIRADEDLTEG